MMVFETFEALPFEGFDGLTCIVDKLFAQERTQGKESRSKASTFLNTSGFLSPQTTRLWRLQALQLLLCTSKLLVEARREVVGRVRLGLTQAFVLHPSFLIIDTTERSGKYKRSIPSFVRRFRQPIKSLTLAQREFCPTRFLHPPRFPATASSSWIHFPRRSSTRSSTTSHPPASAPPL